MLDQATIDHLVDAARRARQAAYAPYSRFAVGAAVLTHAVSEGETNFAAIAVVTSIDGSPCGACRQVMAEFGLTMPVIIADLQQIHRIATVAALLPGAFTSDDLRSASQTGVNG